MSKPSELSDTLPASADPADPTPPANTPAAPGGPRTPGATPAHSGEHLPYQSWDRYQISSFLGAGGMGAVYKARDPRLGRSVAIKFLRSGQIDVHDTRQRRQFQREARAQARIEHPHICKIYEVGEVDGQPYIAMQLIHGASLAGLQQVMSREDKVRTIQRVAEALHAAHAQGLIHRDIKPGNILVERRSDGSFWPYLMDFGLAREVESNTQTSSGGVEGTPAYMAPEQARGETRQLDARADVYGLGAALYSTLAGRPPFVGNSTDVLVAVLLSDPPPLRTLDPAIPPALETIVGKCLEKEPARRYASAQELADDLGRFLDGGHIAARPPGLGRRLRRLVERHKLLAASVVTALLATLILGGLALRIRRQAAEQARLAQYLGQEIAKMEWLLRSARQLPLHDLDREKRIIRWRMGELQAELTGYGPLGRGLVHYSLGRGHLALHEYPQALGELEQARAAGVQGAELDYALGFVLGKQFEQAMYEARLAGGGDWAEKQLRELEPKYLAPAIAALSRSRSLKLDAPQYLEGLIAFYRRDYDAALRQAAAALIVAPWLYEAIKLTGDVHLERALQARDRGRYPEAEREFAAAVDSFQQAAAIGQSDSEVYEGLAEAWVRQIEMAQGRGLPTEPAYVAAVAASDKLTLVEPQSTAGSLKHAFAALMTMGVGTELSSAERAGECLRSAQAVLAKQPEHPYASEAAADCQSMLAAAARERGEDPRPFLRKALALLEPIVRKSPRFLWGNHDLASTYAQLGSYEQKLGIADGREKLERSLAYEAAAAALDPSYAHASAGALDATTQLLAGARSELELTDLLGRAEGWFTRCMGINQQDSICRSNFFQLHTQAASRLAATGREAWAMIERAGRELAEARKLGSAGLDTEQYAALLHRVEAGERVRRREDPGPALAELAADVGRCLKLSPRDAMCRTLDAQGAWAQADWGQGPAAAASLATALTKAQLATASPEVYPDAWQTLAETHLRLARLESGRPAVRDSHVAAGLAALDKVFAVNPRHAPGLVTRGGLELLCARTTAELPARQAAAAAAVQALTRAGQCDPLLAPTLEPLLAEAGGLGRR